MANMRLKEATECTCFTGAKHNIILHLKSGSIFDQSKAGKRDALNKLIIDRAGGGNRNMNARTIYTTNKTLSLVEYKKSDDHALYKDWLDEDTQKGYNGIFVDTFEEFASREIKQRFFRDDSTEHLERNHWSGWNIPARN